MHISLLGDFAAKQLKSEIKKLSVSELVQRQESLEFMFTNTMKLFPMKAQRDSAWRRKRAIETTSADSVLSTSQAGPIIEIEISSPPLNSRVIRPVTERRHWKNRFLFSGPENSFRFLIHSYPTWFSRFVCLINKKKKLIFGWCPPKRGPQSQNKGKSDEANDSNTGSPGRAFDFHLFHSSVRYRLEKAELKVFIYLNK